MKRRYRKYLWRGGITLVIVAAVLLFLLSRIDRSIPLPPEANVQKSGAIEIADASTVDHRPYLEYLQVHALPPVDYIVEKFRTHDVVILGEAHQIREDCELISASIEPLYRRAGVKILAMELVKHKRDEELRSLLTAPAYDEPRIVQMFRDDYFYWGFAEYLDILKAVWQFNQSLPKDAEPFAVIGLQPDLDSYDVWCGSLAQKIFELPLLLRMEQHYARPVQDVLNRHEKVLVQVGYHHSFPHYRLAKVVDGMMYGEFARKRMGHLLADEFGERVFQVSLHVRHDASARYQAPPQTPLITLLETLYVENGGVPLGFDVEHSPFAMLRDSSSKYFKYQKPVTFSDVAQGYILPRPYSELHCVNWVNGYVNATNFEQLQTYGLQHHLLAPGEGQTPEDLEQRFTELLAEGRRFE